MGDLCFDAWMRMGVTALWGIYLACSWTWCIGMYLPVILLERFGWPGFIAFAIPNIIGCVGFGYVIRNRSRSEMMVANHGAAMTWFSVITVMYHTFFLVFLFTELAAVPTEMKWAAPAASITAWAIAMVLSFLPSRDWLALAVVVYGVSVAALVAIGLKPLGTIGWTGTWTNAQLAWLAPTLVFGFLLCPYLDLTFHRAIQESPSRHAFGVFGLAFAVMLVLTCVVWNQSKGLLPVIALGHLLAQSIFTMGAHLREIRLSSAIVCPRRKRLALVLPLAGVALLYVAAMALGSEDAGETTYLRFLVFYGLVFPGYVMLRVMSPGVPLVVFGVVVAVSVPLYELGFIGGKTWLLVISLCAFEGAAWVWRVRAAK